ncbi:uncharacterized protein PgNI_11844 [Pyricularia grisea]|uniref:Uncharacterized protein n=1 Tax=Pyricularia grisea TaxID=148305 RepID=A0A6P8AN50_PYRGI|nr:uncharacterized protein PgNI_11844 [Pyricularia grisea]TLD03455.1 hypothetical protein PgNI_11844 [Pyricularia grisea]
MVHAQKEAGKGRTGCKGRRRAERACFLPSLLVSDPCCQVGADLCAFLRGNRPPLGAVRIWQLCGWRQNLKAELIDSIWLAPWLHLRQGELAFMHDGCVFLVTNSVQYSFLLESNIWLGSLLSS